jgi:hypothetical protein
MMHIASVSTSVSARTASRVRKQVRKSLNGWKNGWFNVRNPDKIADWIEIVLWATVSFPLTVTSHLFSGLRAASQAVCPAPARVAANSAGHPTGAPAREDNNEGRGAAALPHAVETASMIELGTP